MIYSRPLARAGTRPDGSRDERLGRSPSPHASVVRRLHVACAEEWRVATFPLQAVQAATVNVHPGEAPPDRQPDRQTAARVRASGVNEASDDSLRNGVLLATLRCGRACSASLAPELWSGCARSSVPGYMEWTAPSRP
ncbi:hypothetical protein AAFF_G00095680 [Aldrovandia affinis]|uniref:Uncharacterized protein n=1 Tax=Aldrovandia affinis TaxID=143900 RepID=A0AAD7WCQ7_9TELE|nr:hypothetical protein AAFF_G00095680 [Aldrovandia affinis]